ncbi:MAG: FAD-dependent oxidoreductase, partial [Clostridia bacterium]|nr:FAD-dependent oxidoreductase [Clostridia bacterium]
LDTMVLELSDDLTLKATSAKEGIFYVKAQAVILAMGCRERPAGALGIAGERPAGVFTAGTAQKYVNLKGILPGKEVVILGSGDIGLIMARRMTLEGATVKAVCELLPYSGGLARNIEQCLNDFGIPLKLSHTVTELHGQKRLEGVTVCKVDETLQPISETAEYIPCDTLLLSCGLLPENELTQMANIPLDPVTGGAKVDQSRMTEKAGVFACGNVLQVHDLVDYVSEEAAIAGQSAAAFVLGKLKQDANISVVAGEGVRYTVPQRITKKEDTAVYFRVRDVLYDVTATVKTGETVLLQKKKIKVAPGEMERLTLKAELLEKCEGKPLCVCVEGKKR